MNNVQALSYITGASYNLFHAPYFTREYGTAPESERRLNPESAFCGSLDSHLRSFAQVLSYPPNQAYIGNIDPRELPERPWVDREGEGTREGKFGSILEEAALYGLMKYCDVFDLVQLEEKFTLRVLEILRQDKALVDADLSKLEKGVSREVLEKETESGALPFKWDGEIVGCVKGAHPTDVNLSPHTILENLAAKATGVYAARRLLLQRGVGGESVDYIIETSEEACGDINQRGGGNFAKSIGELAGCTRATGSDVRSFCAGPVHGIMQAAALVASGTFRRVMVLAGGTTAKLGMNSKRHMEKGLPVLEDCMGSFAVLVDGDSEAGLLVRTDAVGRHKIGSGASPQAVIGDLVVEPLYTNAGLKIDEVDFFAPELQNPEITENAGAGNVTLANLKMIAAMAVMKKEIQRSEIDQFIERHGFPGWAPTQGHIPSGVPALGWFLEWAKGGNFRRGLVIGKGSLFLGRMTNLFDGVSLLLESPAATSADTQEDERDSGKEEERKDFRVKRVSGKSLSKYIIGLTVPGSESGHGQLYRGAEEAMRLNPGLSVRFFGDPDTSPEKAQEEMEEALHRGDVQGAVTFHYPFPIGTATVGLVKAPGTGRDLFISTTTGAVSTDRIGSLVENGLLGTAAAKAYGIENPRVGFLNLDGAAAAVKKIRQLNRNGWNLLLGESIRGQELLRGNDLLGGACDVVVCDSLTGNALMKILASYSTGGRTEVAGFGYGPGLGGKVETLVNIISRATSAPVVANALSYTVRMIEGDVLGILRAEYGEAEKAGLIELLGKEGGGSGSPAPAGKGPERKTVDSEIEGLDVLELEEAVRMLSHRGVYAEAGMGCTGPVVMVSRTDREKARSLLEDENYL